MRGRKGRGSEKGREREGERESEMKKEWHTYGIVHGHWESTVVANTKYLIIK